MRLPAIFVGFSALVACGSDDAKTRTDTAATAGAGTGATTGAGGPR